MISMRLKITPLILILVTAYVHPCALLCDAHPHEDPAAIECLRACFCDRKMSSEHRKRRAPRYGLPSYTSREFGRISSHIKTIVALIHELIGFISLVRNWYSPLLARLSPFVGRDAEVEVQTRSGLKYILRPKRGDLSIFNEVLYHDIYTRRFPVNGTVVDIGAHVGVFAIYAGVLGDTVICYEPHPENFELLQKNVALNALTNVKAAQQAVGDTRGIKRLSVSRPKSYGHTLYPSNNRDFTATIDVQSVTLEDIILSNRLDRINFLKLHCEGAEFDILNGAPQDVLDKVDKIVIKYSRDGTKIAELLTAREFEVMWDGRDMLYAVKKEKDAGLKPLCSLLSS